MIIVWAIMCLLKILKNFNDMEKCLFTTAIFILNKYKAENIKRYHELKNVKNKYKY